ncbi:MAG TPA: hypothetical protein VEL28_18535 [Candidatus Binatia bacterium]|nr:hypothetical protein [Candidatus Binatia bacterium]
MLLTTCCLSYDASPASDLQITSTTTPEEGMLCRVKFGLRVSGDIGGVTVLLDYSDLDGDPVVIDDTLDCEGLSGFATSFTAVQGQDRIEAVFSDRRQTPCQVTQDATSDAAPMSVARLNAPLEPEASAPALSTSYDPAVSFSSMATPPHPAAKHAHYAWAHCYFRLLGDKPATETDFDVVATSVLDRDGIEIGDGGSGHVGRIQCDGFPVPSSSGTSTSTTCTTHTIPPPPGCGDPDADGEYTATDASFVLRASVGLVSCASSVCDVLGQNGIRASDALVVLNVAVEAVSDQVLDCP